MARKSPKKSPKQTNGVYIVVGVIVAIVAICLLAVTGNSKTSSQLGSGQAPYPRGSADDTVENMNMMASDIHGAESHSEIVELTNNLRVAIEKYKVSAEGAAQELILTANDLSSAYLSAGYFKETIQIAEQTLSVVGSAVGQSSLVAVLPLKYLAQAYAELGQMRDSIMHLSHIETIFNTNLGSTHPDTVSVGINIISLYLQMGDVEAAMLRCDQYKEWLEEALQETATERQEVAAKLSQQSDDGETLDIDAWEKEISEAELDAAIALGEIHHILASIWHREMEEQETGQGLLGKRWDTSPEFDEYEETETESNYEEISNPIEHVEKHRLASIKYRQMVVDILDCKKTGDESNRFQQGGVDTRAKLAQSIQSLAHMRFQNQRTDDETVLMFEQLVSIAEAMARDEIAARADAMANKGEDDTRDEDFDEYVDEEERGGAEEVEVVDPITGEALLINKDVAIALNNLGSIYTSREEFNLARDCFVRSIAIRSALGSGPGDIAVVKSNLARVHMMSGALSEAEREYSEALDMVAQSVGKSHPYYERINEPLTQVRHMINNRALFDDAEDSDSAM
mmetsp:Transcript_6152/g.9281  ORF Transcript_6152/g.9281 Transcript_6152/m.9281 type:complete len:571 (+) Transcript_6152:80-1792(+)|eukprot:CAMPEP_0185036938 /NCGR_PEP_ID=MMETSP1103-20130426/30682_1 /TAXON_ID=36769 /ORGANISM="Paraphysomonas bandaiensis, Strain Caron Lab Isolate" /LENGTH=570 /DNA_ID=CAMNT_0027574707 /DNA_START=1 /DNA_END=1713 /DNA_ORIENTATION=-